MNSFRNIYNSNLSHRAKSVYMYLKDRADSEGRCWPAIRTIALELGLSRSTVKRALDDLCRAGLLQKDPRWRENGRIQNIPYPVIPGILFFTVDVYQCPRTGFCPALRKDPII